MNENLCNPLGENISLTDEQDACLKYNGSKTLVVKGLAGSGKSLVLMALAKRYLEATCDEEKSVAVVTFQNTLADTMRETLEKNSRHSNKACVSTVNALLSKVYSQLANAGDAPKRKHFPKDKDVDICGKFIEEVLKQHRELYGRHRFHSIDTEFWKEEFAWMKNMNIWSENAEQYIASKRKGRGNRYRFSKSDYDTAFQLFRMYCEKIESKGYADWEDQALYLIRHSELVTDSMKFKYVLIDEAQDLSLAQLKALMVICKKDMIIAMDANQKIHDKYWTPKMLGIEATTQNLTKSMRTTIQIDNLAESVRSANDNAIDANDTSVRAVPDRAGVLPKLVHFDEPQEEEKYVIQHIRALLAGNPNMTIGIIAARKKALFKFSKWLADANIPYEKIDKDSSFSMLSSGVKLVTAYGSKGLEFNAVIIPNFMEGSFPYHKDFDDEEEEREFLIRMRNLAYVAMTRAKNMLVITWYGNKGSRFIEDMNPDLYETEGTPFNIRKKAITQTDNYETPEPEKSEEKDAMTLPEFLTSNGVQILDERDNGGRLWVFDAGNAKDVIHDSRSKFGIQWIYKRNGNIKTNYKAAWYLMK